MLCSRNCCRDNLDVDLTLELWAFPGALTDCSLSLGGKYKCESWDWGLAVLWGERTQTSNCCSISSVSMLFLCLVTMLGLVRADPSSLCDSDCPPDWKSVEGDCVMFMYGWEEDMARQVCRGLKAEFSEFFISRSDSDSATRHSLPVCLLRRETQGRDGACF